MKTTLERIKEMPTLKRAIISKLFNYVKDKRDSNVWRKFKGDFSFEGQDYTLECVVAMDNEMFIYRDMHIEYKQTVIDVDDMVRRGLIT